MTLQTGLETDPAVTHVAPLLGPALSSGQSSGSQPPDPGRGRNRHRPRCWSHQKQSQVGSRAPLCLCCCSPDQSSECHLPAGCPALTSHLDLRSTLVTTPLAELSRDQAWGNNVHSGRWREKGWRPAPGGICGLRYDCPDPNETLQRR